jgi:transcriptional regulator of arginine metabolism
MRTRATAVPVTASGPSERREAILQILLSRPAATQQQLVAALNARGLDATQSSISRDLRELGAIKTPRGYELAAANPDGEDELAAVAELLRDQKTAGPHLVVIRTAIGAAQRVALALDRSNWPEIVGNVGGDDTVFTATSNGTAQRRLLARINRIAGLARRQRPDNSRALHGASR